MSLALDKRQRAMLREMGIRLWQAPTTTPQAPREAAAAGDPVRGSAPGPQPPSLNAAPAALARAPGAPARPANRASAESANSANSAEAARAASRTHAGDSAFAETSTGTPTAAATGDWTLGPAQALYTDAAENTGATASAMAEVAGAGGRWLLLIETPLSAADDPGYPLTGEAGKLLDNMLHAVGLRGSAAARWAPVLRGPSPDSAAGAAEALPLAEALAALVSAERPDLLLLMGRLAVQALLQTQEPLGKLRGRALQVAGVAAVASYDAPYLLRNLPDKAKAWDDLCRAQHLARQPRPA
jgi:DNA polymerase